MVSKKSLKNKAQLANKQKIDKSKSDSKARKAIFVSQNVIISSILDKSLIDGSVQANLPIRVGNIYKAMMADVGYINETLTKKDYSFLGCNLAFKDGEKMISSKRQALVEFMMKREKKKIESLKKDSAKKRKSSEAMLNDNLKKKKLAVEEIRGKVEEERDSELSGENNHTFRPRRKKKKPSKFKNENPEKDFDQKSEIKLVNELVPETEGDDVNLKLVKSKSNGKIKKKIEENDENKVQIIDLVEENSSDGSENQKFKQNSEKAVGATGKSKVYFREPVTRKPTKLTNKRLKEHTLLDKILLGINCIRKWTDKGLHLSRLCETDLVLLNKRLTSVGCILADLEEHTDDNNNRYLSVLLKSDLFSQFVIPAQSLPDTVSIKTTSPPQKPREPIEYSENPENVSYNRPKSKQHIPAMYRQRHAVPSILSKPSVKSSENKPTYSESSNSSFKSDDVSYSMVKFEEKFSNIAPAPSCPTESPLLEPQMTASQLLRLKSQKSNADANQKKVVLQTSEQQTASINAPPAQLPPHYALPNGFVNDRRQQQFVYQTGVHSQRNPVPVFLVPNTKLVPLLPNNQQRQIRIPISKTYHTVTKIQRIPLQNNCFINNLPAMSNQTRIADNPVTNNLSSQSVILKNLLQQSSTQLNSFPNTVSANQMMPLSVFQNSKSKRQFVSINQSSYHK